MILVPGRVSELEQKSANGKGLFDDFIKGMFTTILATPCSGPLLGATLAWTLLQPPVVVYVVFTAIGAGMAFPYVVFSSSSRLLKLVPKPGNWMEIFKQLMGFLLFGFAIYLMIGLPRDMILPTVGLCLVLTFALLFYKSFSPFGSPIGKKLLIGCIGALIIAGGWFANFRVLYNFISEEAAVKAEKGSRGWEEFTPAKLLNAHTGKKHVIVDFTANWCMNCQFNKITVYHTKEINNLIDKKNIVALKADITQENPAAESLLHHLGSRSVPFFAVFPADDPYNPIIMRDILNKKSVVKVLQGL
jgi:thiol:disulfide interchange protein DsbD